MRAASPQLIERLKRLGLCNAADLRRCHGLVRDLSRDLPAFDSVWVDALVQKRRLTPFQAELLLSGEHERLNAGPCVLVDKLGHHQTGHTFLARRRESQERCVIKFVDPDEQQIASVRTNFEQLATAFRSFTHTAIVGPHASLEHDGRIVAISRHVPGVSLRDTLIQAGRFTAADVIEIGRQVLSGLAAMESKWQAHGDIRIANLRLGTDGLACLVNFGVSVAGEHRFIVHHRLRPDRCDTVAPELIGTNRAPDAQSDLYALGCLLWQLLCGRPPFAFADPLEKLAAHQMRAVPDVRDIAPDAPGWLAAAIATMTNRDRVKRPPSFADALRRWEQHSGSRAPGPNALNRFSPRVREMAKRSAAPGRTGSWMLAATAVVAICGAGLVFAGNSASGRWLPAAWAGQPPATETKRQSTGLGDQQRPRPLPAPDANGVITLPNAGPWQSTRFESPGPIVFKGSGSQPAIVVLDEPLVVKANQVLLENIVLRATSSQALLDCECLRLRVRKVRFEGHGSAAGIRWQTPDLRDRSGRTLTITDSEISNCEVGVDLQSPPADVNLGNVLFTRVRSGLRFDKPVPAGQNTNVRMIRVTQRLATHAIETTLPDNGGIPGRVTVWLQDSVFALHGEQAAAFALVGSELPPPSSPIVQTRSRRDADPSLLSVGSAAAVWTNPQNGMSEEVPDDLVQAGDLAASALTFDSVNPTVASESELTGFEAPRRSTTNPGIDPSGLP